MDTTEVRDFIYNYLNNIGIFIKETYFFEDSDFLTTEFKIKGIKHYLFGLGVYKENDIFKCSLFSEHKDYINKFKPTVTEISQSFNIKGNESFIYEIHLFQEIVNKIKHCPLFMKYYLYCSNDVSIVKWSLHEFWFYKIEKPFRDFFSKQGNYAIGSCIKGYLKLRYRNKIDHIEIPKLYSSECIIHPGIEIRVCIKDKYIDTLGFKLFHKLDSFRGFYHELSIDICELINNKWKAVCWE